MDKAIVLASSSPRRRELLAQAGVSFSVVVSGCDETPIADETPRAMVERLSVLKAEAVAELHPDAWVIGADTTVWIDNQTLGKPESVDEACAMLKRTQGRQHEVWGGIAIINRASKTTVCKSYMTRVIMSVMSESVIQWYVSSGEPMDKAGSYAIQGLGLQFVDSIEGSYSNVVGLNISALMILLNDLDLISERQN